MLYELIVYGSAPFPNSCFGEIFQFSFIPLFISNISLYSGVSGKKLFTTTKITLPPLHFGSPNSKPQSVSNSGRTAKSFRLAHRVNMRFSKIFMCNARWCLTCQHIPCKSIIISSINGNRNGIQIDKDVDWNISNSIYVITWEAKGCGT